MQDYETLKSYELIPKQKRIILRRILISDYKCWKIQIVEELFIDFQIGTHHPKNNAGDLGWFVLQQQAGYSYFGAVALPVLRVPHRIKNV